MLYGLECLAVNKKIRVEDECSRIEIAYVDEWANDIISSDMK